MLQKKLQIALEFMVIFSFVLVVFMFLFALIATQRAQTINSQIFSQEQLVAQSVAAQLDRALQSGNGYVANVPIINAIGTLGYQLIITKNGAVIVNATVGRQVMQAIAYSSVKNIVSDSSYLQAGTPYYLIPIASGALTIQNSFGNICVDYSCPTTSNQASSISLSSQVVRVAYSGNSTGCTSLGYVPINAYIASPISLNSLTITWWANPIDPHVLVHLNSADSSPGAIPPSGGKGVYCGIDSASKLSYCEVPNAPSSIYGPLTQLNMNTWYFFSLTLDGSVPSGQATLYVNANPGTPIDWKRQLIGINELDLLGYGPNCAFLTKGYLSNVQIYNTVLTPSNILRLYQNGIAGQPVLPSNVVAWYPLNGNANSYGNSGNNGNIHGQPVFPTVSQLFARVTNQLGQPSANVLVGFTTTLGKFISDQVTTNYTNSNGIAVAFLNPQGNNGQALVKAVAYNGNLSLQGNIISWWPLNLGQGNVTHDISGKGNNGGMRNFAYWSQPTGYALKGYPYWSQPNYVSSFDGKSSYVATSYLQNSVTAYTISAWVKTTANQGVIVQDRGSGAGNSITLAICPPYSGQISSCSGVPSIGVNSVNGWIGINGNSIINDGKWHFLAGTFNAISGTSVTPQNFQLFVDGMRVPVNTITIGSSPTSPLTGSGGTMVAYDQLWNLHFAGSLANVQIYNSVLTPSQIMQLYLGGMAVQPYMTPNVLLDLPLNGNANDSSGNSNNEIIYGNLNFVSTSSIPNTNSNATSVLTSRFNGIDSMITTPFTQNNLYSFTVTLWVNATNTMKMTSGNGYTILSSLGSNNFQMWLSGNGLSGLGASPGYGDEKIGIGPNAYNGYGINGNSWNFLAVAVSNGKATLYANGAPPYNVSIVGGPYSISGLAIAPSASGISYLNGSMANVQLYNSTLTPNQVLQIYQEGMAGLPLNNTNANSKLLAWYPLNGNADDYSGNANDANGANVVYVQQQFITPSLINSLNDFGVSFNGGSTYISTKSSLSFGSALTISGWFKVNSYTPPQNAFNGYSGFIASTYGQYSLGVYASSSNKAKPWFNITSIGSNTPDFSLTTGRWYFVSATYSGTSLAIFINGVKVGTASGSGTMANYGYPVILGCQHNDRWCSFDSGVPLFNGSLANVQIYNTALNAQQVQQLYQAQMPPTASSIIPLSWFK